MAEYRPAQVPVWTSGGAPRAQAYTCQDCGALVLDVTLHDSWHTGGPNDGLVVPRG